MAHWWGARWWRAVLAVQTRCMRPTLTGTGTARRNAWENCLLETLSTSKPSTARAGPEAGRHLLLGARRASGPCRCADGLHCRRAPPQPRQSSRGAPAKEQVRGGFGTPQQARTPSSQGRHTAWQVHLAFVDIIAPFTTWDGGAWRSADHQPSSNAAAAASLAESSNTDDIGGPRCQRFARRAE